MQTACYIQDIDVASPKCEFFCAEQGHSLLKTFCYIHHIEMASPQCEFFDAAQDHPFL